ncbi:MAG: dihydrodipicolinate synthase family protein, partial [bacterium]
LTLPVLSVGGKGVVSVASHVVGNRIKEMIVSYNNGEIKKAAELNKELGAIFSGIFITTNPIPIKAALNLKGMNVGPVRPPLREINQSEKEVLEDILKKLGII